MLNAEHAYMEATLALQEMSRPNEMQARLTGNYLLFSLHAGMLINFLKVAVTHNLCQTSYGTINQNPPMSTKSTVSLKFDKSVSNSVKHRIFTELHRTFDPRKI